MSLAGTYSCTLKTPLGSKSGSLTVVPGKGGDTFTGILSNPLIGSVEIQDGTIDGDMLLCSLAVDKPMKMTVECEVIVDGDSLNGFVTAGSFGEMKLVGERVA